MKMKTKDTAWIIFITTYVVVMDVFWVGIFLLILKKQFYD